MFVRAKPAMYANPKIQFIRSTQPETSLTGLIRYCAWFVIDLVNLSIPSSHHHSMILGPNTKQLIQTTRVGKMWVPNDTLFTNM